MGHKPRSRIILEEMKGETPTHTSLIPFVQEKTSQEKVIDVPLPRRSGRIIKTRVNPEPIIDTQVPQIVKHADNDASGLESSQ